MINYVEDLVLLFGTPTIVISIIAYGILYIKKNNERLDQGTKKFELLEKNMMIIGRTALRLEIVNEKIPMLERARAYEQYVKDFHGNGAITKYYEEEIEPHLIDTFVN